MKKTKIGRVAAALLCAGGLGAGTLGMAGPEAAANPRTPAAGVASTAPCLSGVSRAQVTAWDSPTRRVYVVRYVWIPFVASCLKTE